MFNKISGTQVVSAKEIFAGASMTTLALDCLVQLVSRTRWNVNHIDLVGALISIT